MGCLKLSYRGQGEGVEENASSILWEVYKKGGSGSKKGVEYYRWGFQGQFSEEDAETGWNSFELRMYDPVIGRWTSMDPMVEFYSPYRTGNDPLNQVDPDGGCEKCPGYKKGVSNSDMMLNEIVITPGGASFDAEFQEHAFSGTFDQWQQKYGTPGLTYEQESFIYNLFHADRFFNEWSANTRYERGLMTVAKMARFVDGFTTAGSMGMGAFGSSFSSATPKTFNYTPRGMVKIHGNSLNSPKPTWGYKLYDSKGNFLKNGITNKLKPESRYTKAFMNDKRMRVRIRFHNRRAAYDWEYQQNLIQRGPLNKNMH